MSYKLSCAQMDHTCNWHGETSTEDELLTRFAEHAQQVHNVHTITQTIVNYVRENVRKT